jgi:hypothetical protein
MKVAGIRRRVVLAALIGGAPAIWAFTLAVPAAALPSGCSQVQRTVTCTFASTDSQQTFSVPAGIGSVQIDAVGAPGGGSAGGLGGTASAAVSVTPGQTLFVEVGGAGTATAGGFNGGGSPDLSAASIGGAGGGGGASDVRTVAGSLASRLVVAAGGGGSGAAGNPASLGHGGAADSAGTNGGANGSDVGGGGGGAGTSSAGGTAGTGGGAPGGTAGLDGASGTPGVGGDGAGGPSNTTGGGGGGGYFGGGGGGGGGESSGPTTQAGGGGGGGGSCYALAPIACGAASSSTPSVTITYTVPDTTSPTISIVSPGANAAYPLGTTVPASYSCADEAGGTGLAACQGPVASGSLIDTSAAGAHSFTVTARDNAGNVSSQTVSYTVVAPPTAAISSPAAGGSYRVGQVVHTAFACSEATGGPGIVTCADSNGAQAAAGASQSKSASGVLDTTDPGPHTYTVSVASADGMTGSTAIPYTVAAAPSISISAPIANHTYNIGQAVRVKYTCTDGVGGPGIKSCSGTVRNGRLLNTDSPGDFKFTVTARSRDGQTTKKTVSYSTVAPAGHPALKLSVHGVVLTNATVSVPPPTDALEKLLNECSDPDIGRLPQCNRQGGSFEIRSAFPASARFKKSNHQSLFNRAGHSATLYLYLRGPGNTTVALTFSVAGAWITKLQIGATSKGLVTETITVHYDSLKYQGCSPSSAC